MNAEKYEADERAQFEAWASLHGHSITHTGTGEFCFIRTRELWESWQFDRFSVDAFADAMKDKMDAARAKGRGGWEDPSQCSADDLSRLLREHVDKGDPRDVANFCMMLHQRGEAIAARQPVGQEPIELSGIADALSEGRGFWRTCSGCHESNEGVPTGPYSRVMECHLGTGCSECGGVGAIWDDTDYQAWGDQMAQSLAAQPAQGIDLGQLRKLAMPILCPSLCASDAERMCQRLHTALIGQRDAASGVG